MDKAHQAAMAEKEETLKAYHRLFDSPDGEKVLNDLIRSTYFFQSSVATNKDGIEQPHMTFFNEGRRDVVCSILTALNKTPEYIRYLYSGQGGLTHAHATYTDGGSTNEDGGEQ